VKKKLLKLKFLMKTISADDVGSDGFFCEICEHLGNDN